MYNSFGNRPLIFEESDYYVIQLSSKIKEALEDMPTSVSYKSIVKGIFETSEIFALVALAKLRRKMAREIYGCDHPDATASPSWEPRCA